MSIPFPAMPPFRGLPLFSWRRIRAVSFRLPSVTEASERSRLRDELLAALAPRKHDARPAAEPTHAH